MIRSQKKYFIFEHIQKVLLTFSVVSIFLLLVLGGIFFFTRGAYPAISELAFAESSREIANIGSVVPASCESDYEHTSGECTVTQPTTTVTCSSYTYDNTSMSGECTNTWTNTYNYCTDGTSWTDEGEVTTTCPECTETTDGGTYNDGCAVITWSSIYTTCGNSTSETTSASRDESGCSVTVTTPDPAPVVPNACDSADASLYCSTTCCTTSSGDEKCGSKDCSVTTTTVTTPAPPTVPKTPTPLPSGCGPGTLNDDCYVPYPDLSAGAVTPARVTPDVSATFSATISNIGDDTTGTWFYNFFQIATEVNGGGTVTDLLATSMNALAPGRSETISTSYTFSKGIYSIRACADKSNRSNSGRISESNEGNNCGPWTRLVVKDPPEIQNIGMEFPDISFVCINSETYTATHEESGEIIGQGSTIDGEIIQTKFSEEGNYTLKCLSDPLSARAVVNYTIPEIVLSGLSISANPRTVNNNKSTTVSWSVLNPRPVCNLRAEVVCSDSCSADQLAASSSLNTILKNGTTDANDQYGGGRNIQTAVQKVYTKYSNKAMGKKTFPMSHTTDFVLDCGKSLDGKSLIKKIRIIVAGENEG